METKIKIVVQHFHGCPNSPKMIERVKEAMSEFGNSIEFSEQLIDTPELARQFKFRGSPTLLIQNEDFEDMIAPDNPDLTCRFYQNGLPSVTHIKEKINFYLNSQNE